MKFIVINRKWLFIVIGALLAFSLYFISREAIPTFKTSNNHGNDLIINMVTGEFSTTTTDGKKIESYRFDPGTIVIPKDQDVTLSIFGVNGAEHPFFIEGTDIKGTVKKGEETIVPLHFKEEGTYRLICDTHTHDGHGSISMIAYIIVD
ncbi:MULTISPECIES: cupredoxin domain-containing protein [Metabacillus]|uniref:Cupredoxin domain-containing protein n=1 Tax=Metabacillus rhizolycopersici TaxID=2875709 RepID=A0ABS7ULQ8_9BACI|nr:MULTISPECIES: cupredoxin domain-containing protein [Metabacillus]MBZ5749257.1 cupredoxin domain-containing protein [Metabacillus rhizolycopersici]MCM3651972.1 cupredoxin domain-containing protein [Metabacillus litoralis]